MIQPFRTDQNERLDGVYSLPWGVAASSLASSSDALVIATKWIKPVTIIFSSIVGKYEVEKNYFVTPHRLVRLGTYVA